ncbi:MAG: CHAD domain-containing protein [Marinobacter sp.]|uniref:CHAD domain-containing protein n=1 Tax=Marinobacter sp. TaxID=50741 RepID=UPI003C419416
MAQWLLPQPPAQLPTGSFIHIRLPIERWRQLDEGCGTLVTLLTPADFSYAHFARKLKKRADSEGSNPAKDIPAALHHQIEHLQKLERGVVLGFDDEFLHQYRIAIRRSRAIAESVQELTGDKSLAKAVKTLRRHARATGPLRDLHVLLQDLPALCGDDHELLQALQQALESEQASKHGKLSARLVSKRYRDSMDHWLNLVASRAFRKQVATLRPADIRKAVARRIKGFNRRTARLDDGTPDDDIHRLRKQLKRLRYLMELDTKRWKSDLKSLKARQQLYGRFQDLHVQIELLQSIRDTSPQHPIAGLGRIIDTLEARKADTRHQILALGGLDGAPLRHPVL